MWALPIIVLQKSPSVGLFTHWKGTWAGFRPSWDRLVLPYWWHVVAMVILLSTRGTAGSDIWFMCLADKPMVRGYHLRDYDWTPLSQNLAQKCNDTLCISALGGNDKRGRTYQASSVVKPQQPAIGYGWLCRSGSKRYQPHAKQRCKIIRRRPSSLSGCRT